MDEPGVRRRIALVTGGSRGVGAATAEALAGRGFAVLLTYRNKGSRASQVVERIAGVGGQARAIASDMTVAAERQRLVSELTRWGNGRLDLLILNAAGGLERDRLASDPDYPMRMNRDAQIELVESMLPLMRGGGTVVYITSHWAHLYGQIVQLPWYEPVARSKHAGELALRAMQTTTLAKAGVRLLVATGDIIEGTIMTRLLDREEPGLTTARRHLVGALPTPDDAANAIANAAVDPTLSSGQTLVIGGTLQSVLDSFGSVEQA